MHMAIIFKKLFISSFKPHFFFKIDRFFEFFSSWKRFFTPPFPLSEFSRRFIFPFRSSCRHASDIIALSDMRMRATSSRELRFALRVGRWRNGTAKDCPG